MLNRANSLPGLSHLCTLTELSEQSDSGCDEYSLASPQKWAGKFSTNKEKAAALGLKDNKSCRHT